MSRNLKVIILAVSLLLTSGFAAAQSSACQAPTLKPAPPGANLFNDKQEMELAGVLHRQLEQDMKIVEDEKLTRELQNVGDRLALSLPPSGIKFRYFVVDIPEANAFSLTGGNIYLSRKLIAFLHSEDELAGVIAHEMGHIVAHQGAIEVSRRMKAVLGNSQLHDDDDIEEKYNEMLDSYLKKPGAFRGHDREDQEQLGADQVAVYALAAAGYDVKTLSEFWDRFSENKGKKGNFLTNLIGGAPEQQRRFRDMLKNSNSLPPNCIAKHVEAKEGEFKKWQRLVVAYDGIGHPEKLNGLITRKALTPQLRSEVVKIKVSPNGKYVLVQDQSSITILNHADLKTLFHVEADDARDVQFTQDSSGITFYTLRLFGSPRIEIWDIEAETLRGVYEPRFRSGCTQAALSPNGQYFACISPGEPSVMGDVWMTLRLMNVETSEMVLEKQDFFAVDRFSMFFWLLFAVESGNGKVQEMRVGALHFSPDSKYLLFGKTNFTFAVVSATGAKVNLPNSIKEIMKGAFSFLDGDRVIGVAGSKGEHGAALKFPTGEPVYSNLRMGMVYIEGASKGEYALLSPFNEYALGVFDLKANKFLIGSKKPSADIYNDEYLFERVDGELANYDLVGKKELNKVELHESPLGRITATAASEDLNYVAISGTVRGAVWNLAKGARVSHLRRFDSATVDDSGFTIADFPPEGEGGRRQFGLIDTAKNSATTVEAEENVKYLQAGPYLVLRSPEKKQDWRKNVTFEVKDLKSNKSLWERKFPNGTPAFHVAPQVDSVVFVYDVNDVDGKAVLQSNEELRGKVQALKTREHAYVIETLDAKTGKVVGLTAIDTGKGAFHLRDAFRAGQSLVISDTRDRVQVFGFDGTRKGRLQSYGATASRDGKLMAALVGRGKLVIYDLEKFHKVDELDFSSELALLRFSNGGDRLLVVTRDQKAYYFDTKQLLGSSQVAAK